MTIEVTVHRAQKEDLGKRTIRIPRAVRDRLGVTEGDEVIVSSGRQRVVLFVKKADEELVGKTSCRLSGEVRSTLGLKVGEKVTLSREVRVSLEEIDDDAYDIVVIEKEAANPFQIRPRLVRIAQRAAGTRSDTRARAKALFDWIQKHVRYGGSQRGQVGYRDSVEVKETGEGVCGEQAFLFVAMARCVGLRSRFVIVSADHQGKAVNHACASVHIGPESILVDPAYYTFGIKHRKYEILDDLHAHRAFQLFRGGP